MEIPKTAVRGGGLKCLPHVFFYKTCRMCVALVSKVGKNVSSNILQK